MYFFTGLASFTVLAATNSVFAAPTGNDTAAALQRRDYAWCKMKPDVSPEGQISQHFTIEVDSIQDDGLCGGFWCVPASFFSSQVHLSLYAQGELERSGQHVRHSSRRRLLADGFSQVLHLLDVPLVSPSPCRRRAHGCNRAAVPRHVRDNRMIVL